MHGVLSLHCAIPGRERNSSLSLKAHSHVCPRAIIESLTEKVKVDTTGAKLSAKPQCIKVNLASSLLRRHKLFVLPSGNSK